MIAQKAQMHLKNPYLVTQIATNTARLKGQPEVAVLRVTKHPLSAQKPNLIEQISGEHNSDKEC